MVTKRFLKMLLLRYSASWLLSPPDNRVPWNFTFLKWQWQFRIGEIIGAVLSLPAAVTRDEPKKKREPRLNPAGTI